jgi:hypothetical protein
MNSIPVFLKFSDKSIVIFSGSRFSKITRGNDALNVVRGLSEIIIIRCFSSRRWRKVQAAFMLPNDPPIIRIVFAMVGNFVFTLR